MAPSDYDIAVTKDFIRHVRKHEQYLADTVKYAKARWSYLTRQYKKGLRNPREKSIYHDELDFLNPFVQQIDDVEDDEMELSTNQEPEEDESRPKMRENFYQRPISSLSGKNSSRIARFSNENRPSTSLSRHSPFSEIKNSRMSVFESSEPMQIDDTEDELMPLFLSWYRTTKKLPPLWRRFVKRKISDFIDDTETKFANQMNE
ncbi:Protein of unknown function [Cotesia congregata]|uniref:MADF domain-containing protein n=1 Tax=Cotesia congregata TaxID=51543 RepID=A0A8J2E0L3_COTCN|nr:Protein of unknown function [Cotesia congregata]